VWLDTATAGSATLKVYDGTTWRTVWNLNTASGVITFPAANYLAKSGDTMTGALYLPDGSAAAPILSFSGDTNTGLWRSGADTLALVTGGAARLTLSTTLATSALPVVLPGDPATALQAAPKQYVDAVATTAAGKVAKAGDTMTGALALADGLVGTPALTFGTDLDVGMYRVGGNQLGFATGGTLRLTVGIATITSTSPFVGPTGTAAAPAFSFTGEPDTGLWNAGINQVGIATGGTNRLTVATASITSTLPLVLPGDPTAALEAAPKQYVDAVATTAAGKVSKSGDTMTGALVVAASSASELVRITQTGAGNALVVEDSANPDATPFVVTGAGLVGIGTTAPTVALDIEAGDIRVSKGSPTLRLNRSSGAAGAAILQFASGDLSRFVLSIQTAESGDSVTGAGGGDLVMTRWRNDGTTSLGTTWNIDRETGEWGIGGAALLGTALCVHGDMLRLTTAKTPATATATGTAGQICWDSGFVYVCVGTNSWKRAAIAAW
jgi:hypothetical protein